MTSEYHALRVRVPATSANLGPGFDVLGLALGLWNTFTISPANRLEIELPAGNEKLPRDASNLFYKAFASLFEMAGLQPPPIHVRMDLAIPSGSGLGSSATAVVGGLVAANAWLRNHFTREELVPLAVDLEHGNHADNVAPALLGGLVVNVYDPHASGQRISLKVPFPEDLKAVLLIPHFEMDTVKGRALMPQHYEKSDVIFSTGRVALLLSALQTGRYDLLRAATQDTLHQPYRTQVFPAMPTLIEAALEAGAYGACLSGGGSSVLAFVDDAAASQVGSALLSAATSAGLNGEVRTLEVDREGAQVTSL